MFRARPPFFGMKAACFMLQSRAGGSSALRAPPPQVLRPQAPGALWGCPLPSPLTPPTPLRLSPGSPRCEEPQRRGRSQRGRRTSQSRRCPARGPRGRPLILVSPHPTPRKAPPVRRRVASTVDHSDPCPQDSQLVDGQTAVSTPRRALTRHQREGLSRSWGPPGALPRGGR